MDGKIKRQLPKRPKPRLLSHWEGYCVVRGHPSDLFPKWYQMVYYAMCAGQVECCLMKISFGTPESDSFVTKPKDSIGNETITLKDNLKSHIDEWCDLHGISHYIKRPSDNTGRLSKLFDYDAIQTDFAYLMACWSVPPDYKYDHPDPFASSSSE